LAQQDKLPPGYDPQQDPIEVVDYDPTWHALYLKEEMVLKQGLIAFPGLVLEHFGSSAVPGLAAKPILDIMLAVGSRHHWPSLVEPLQALGYAYWRENPNENEMFFVKGMPPHGEKRTHHLHVYDFQGPRWKKELAFRDHLRRDSQDAHRYEALKRELAQKFRFDREAYTNAKTDFIESVLGKIGQG
jgi:GrpB-like predicted nucleotidyltransferase (UPF0157 family)